MESKTKVAKALSQPKPFLKWAGGKRALLPELLPRIGRVDGIYFEPFLGAGSVAISLPPETKMFLTDTNSELVNAFRVVRDSPEDLIAELSKHVNTKEHFTEVRSWDRNPNFPELPPVERAARFIYLNKTCFNGLYRVNKAGHFNVPYGDQPNAKILDAENLRSVSRVLGGLASAGAKTQIFESDFAHAISKAGSGDVIYADPPYDPASATAKFVSYQPGGFNAGMQIALRDELEAAHGRGARIIASNNDTPFIRDIYAESRGWLIEPVVVKRAISASASGRGVAKEVILSLT